MSNYPKILIFIEMDRLNGEIDSEDDGDQKILYRVRLFMRAIFGWM